MEIFFFIQKEGKRNMTNRSLILLSFILTIFISGCVEEKGKGNSMNKGPGDIKEIQLASKAAVKDFLAKGKVTIFEFGAPW
ncbi:hypothetical protein ACFL35_03520 [Candidatus Riflebacteria bacterium]